MLLGLWSSERLSVVLFIVVVLSEAPHFISVFLSCPPFWKVAMCWQFAQEHFPLGFLFNLWFPHGSWVTLKSLSLSSGPAPLQKGAILKGVHEILNFPFN